MSIDNRIIRKGESQQTLMLGDIERGAQWSNQTINATNTLDGQHHKWERHTFINQCGRLICTIDAEFSQYSRDLEMIVQIFHMEGSKAIQMGQRAWFDPLCRLRRQIRAKISIREK